MKKYYIALTLFLGNQLAMAMSSPLKKEIDENSPCVVSNFNVLKNANDQEAFLSNGQRIEELQRDEERREGFSNTPQPTPPLFNTPSSEPISSGKNHSAALSMGEETRSISFHLPPSISSQAKKGDLIILSSHKNTDVPAILEAISLKLQSKNYSQSADGTLIYAGTAENTDASKEN